MGEAPEKVIEPEMAPAIADHLRAIYRQVMQWMPLKARLAVLAGLLGLITLVVYTFWPGRSATLNLICRHNLRTAELSVSVDGKVAFSDQISGDSKRRFGILDKKTEGTYSKSLSVPTGEHVIAVNLKSPAEGFDQTKRCGVSMVPGQEATIQIATQHGGMSLSYQGPKIGTAKDSGSDYSAAIRSVLFTVMGSALSATVGYMVQEFLRSRKKA